MSFLVNKGQGVWRPVDHGVIDVRLLEVFAEGVDSYEQAWLDSAVWTSSPWHDKAYSSVRYLC